ncbi:hypothetical protein DRF57_00110 [Chryseobacterium rhizosphaerae]|uniref:YD repeat-containing protein n=2 Tax=Chryseobacterium rhizosphaerae TaxID=395937 RepID=A0ABX9ISU2_9FLAO|nr:hypothetical protein DRF57_00110 [Chryseobacterium rhizosphaerae]GEN65967.1 hypothetical protein CRH01_05350 [Chryseobacterium rhizosphaerae]
MYAQNSIGGPIKSSIASPSNFSLSSYSNVPVNEATGLPDINIPLLSVPIDNAINYPISLNYNVKNYENEDRISDIGFGWSLLGTSVVYRKIIGSMDECYFSSGQSDLEPDVYYYNLPGLSGKFIFKKESNNTYNLINLSANNAKIEYTRDNSNAAIFKAAQFTITADNGYKYYFQEYDYSQFECEPTSVPVFKSAFYLTKIVSPIGAEIASLDYEKKNKTPVGGIIYQYCKIKSIKTPRGEVSFDFVYDESLEKTVNDPYTLQKISLKNPAGEILYSYVIDNSILTHPYDDPLQRKRILNFVRKNDKNGTKIEQTSFTYKNFADALGRTKDGILEKIISPTGGVVQYNYESNEKFFDYNDPSYRNYLEISGYDPVVQTKETLYNSSFNTETAKIYNFTIPGDVNIAKKFEMMIDIQNYSYPLPDIPDWEDPFFPNGPKPSTKKPSLTFTLKKGTEQVRSKVYKTGGGDTFEFFNTAGNYTLEIVSTDQAKGSGFFSIIGRKFLPGPFRNSVPAEGNRIKNIQYYKNISATSPERAINYGYDSFTLNDSSSGYLVNSEREDNTGRYSSYILYRNVKVWENGKGYTKKTFIIPDDYPKVQNGGTQLEPTYFWPYYNVTKAGLPQKEDIYDEQNTLLASNELNYELDYYSDREYNLNFYARKYSTKPSFIKKAAQKQKLFYPGGKVLESESETQINTQNFKPSYMKSVANGETTEKFLSYPMNLSGYTHLQNAFMTGLPVETQEKENGKLVSRSTTLFNNNSLLPTSVVTSNIADGSTRENLKMDVYDDKGNLLQVSNSAGYTTAMIYGYNQTSLIAKVEGATYNQVASLAADIIQASNNDNLNAAYEPALITALDNFRNNPALAGYQITTYTYDPVVGITSTTPPSGLREIYQYDNVGRLKAVKRMEKDSGGSVTFTTLKEYQYNNKP